jgi:hypothetical protein
VNLGRSSGDSDGRIHPAARVPRDDFPSDGPHPVGQGVLDTA